MRRETIGNLCYAEELQDLVSHVEKAANEYNATNMKVMANTRKTLEVLVDDRKLEQVDSFGYLGSRKTNDANCKVEVKSRLAMSMAAMVKLTKMWKNKATSNNKKL